MTNSEPNFLVIAPYRSYVYNALIWLNFLINAVIGKDLTFPSIIAMIVSLGLIFCDDDKYRSRFVTMAYSIIGGIGLVVTLNSIFICTRGSEILELLLLWLSFESIKELNLYYNESSNELSNKNK